MSNGRPRIHLGDRDLTGSYPCEDVPLTEILFDSDFNCRGEFTYDSVQGLAETINHAGLLYPIILWPKPDLPAGKKYLLVTGHRRYRAYELLKRDRIPAIIRADLDQRKAEIINLLENLERKDLNILQEALALKKRYPNDTPCRVISKELQQSTRWILDRLHLLKFPTDVQEMFAAGRIPGSYIPKLYKALEDKGPIGVIEAAKAIEAARRRADGTVRTHKLPHSLRGTPYPKPSQTEVVQMLTTLLNCSVIGLTPKYGAWREGWISTEDLIAEIERYSAKWKAMLAEQGDLPK